MFEKSKVILILVILNAFLLGTLFQTNKDSQIFAQSDTANNGIIFQFDPNEKDEFFIVDTNQKIILNYSKQKGKGIQLETYRNFDFDSSLKHHGAFKGKKLKQDDDINYDKVKKLVQ